MPPTSQAQLALDPGVSGTRRGTRSCCKCLFWTGLIFAISFSIWVLVAVGFALQKIVSAVQNPHENHYYNASQDLTLGSVVRPLIDNNQTFDIAVTVWVRATEEYEEAHRKRKNPKVVGDDVANGLSGMNDSQPWEDADVKNFIVTSDEGEDFLETPLFSDIIFRGLRMRDKDASAKVQFRLPTARFLAANLTNMDLRGSFVLIPTSPSPLNHLKNYSHWVPSAVNQYPARTWPFPMNSPDYGERMLVDKVVELFGFSIPLLEFHEVKSQCPNSTALVEDKNHTDTHDTHADTTRPAETKGFNADPGGYDSEEEDEIYDRPPANSSARQDPNVKTPIHKRHPYVVTRTHLRIVDQTTLFNHEAYNKAHNKLKAGACGLDLVPPKLSRRLCSRNYKKNGHWETKLQLETSAPENKSEMQTEWAYGPYFDYFKHAAGTKDLVAVPTTRENCTITANGTSRAFVLRKQDEEFMDITWHVSFSGRSPAKMFLADTFGIFATPRITYNQSEYDKVMEQDRTELLNGVLGHRFHADTHPRWRIIMIAVEFIISIVVAILDGHYWYTRISTVSISIPGSILLALSEILDYVTALVLSLDNLHSGFWLNTFFAFPLVLSSLSFLLPTLAMIKAVIRLEWTTSSWIPRRARPNHSERASERLDARTSWIITVAAFVGLSVIYLYFEPGQYLILAPSISPPTPNDIPTDRLQKWSIILTPLHIVGISRQLILNHRSRMFAGQHRVTPFLDCMKMASRLAIFIPAIVGRVDSRRGLSVRDVIQALLLAITVWQALTLRSVPQTKESEEE